MALEPSILRCKPFFFFLLLLISSSSSSSSSSVATDNASSSATSFNFEFSGEHSMDDPSSFSATAAIPYLRVSASFSIAAASPSADDRSDDLAATDDGSDDRAAAEAAAAAAAASDEMRKMLRDVAAALARSGRYVVAAAAIRAHLDELAPLAKATILAPDDRSIAVALYYDSPPRFRLHVVPDYFLTYDELLRLPFGDDLPTLDPVERLVITSKGGGRGASDDFRLNFVGFKAPDLVVGSRIAVHGVHLPIWEFEFWDQPTPQSPSSSSSPSSSLERWKREIDARIDED